MHPADAILLAALRATPRRYRMPPLPGGMVAAAAAGAETALAYAIEAARLGREAGEPASSEHRHLFTSSMAGLIRDALRPDGGDPAYQALVLRVHDREVAEHVRLAAQAQADRRAVRAAVDAMAHPGKLRGRAAGLLHDALARLHTLATQGAWRELRAALQDVLEHAGEGNPRQAVQDAPATPGEEALQALLSLPALQRLERAQELATLPAVQHYRALCDRRGPGAGSAAAAAQGRASARVGEVAEAAVVQAFREVARLLDRAQPENGHRVLRSLRTPQGFPGEAGKAKDEWDVAIVRPAASAGCDIVLLAEVKASPAAATADLSRLVRGLQRLAHAGSHGSFAFVSDSGPVLVTDASLRTLQPHARLLPEHVIYCCSAPVEAQPQVLAAASKAVLFSEPASLAFAQRVARGEPAAHEELAPVWDALTREPRLRATLHQFETAQAVRERMVHPDDLVAAVAQVLA